jgi:tetratricopeptide (TPR) repeat protein
VDGQRGRVGRAGQPGRRPPAAPLQRQERVYDNGLRLLDAGRWEDAVRAFSQVIALKGTRADAALYWTAYAQNRLGQRTDALQAIERLLKEYPDSRYTTQARALDVEVRGDAGQPVNPEAQRDDELKIIALQALQRTDPDRAVQMLEGILRGSSTPGLKTRALFVLAQSATPRARQTLVDAARGNLGAEIQERAIDYLGGRNGGNAAVLTQVYSSASDINVKRRIVRALALSGDSTRLVELARKETDFRLKRDIVGRLSQMRDEVATSYLLELLK